MSDSSENDLARQISNLLKNSFNNQNQTQKLNLSDTLKISLKLNNHNYPLWARMIRVTIGGKSKALLSHLSENPPEKTDDKYEQWEQNDLIVFSWLIQNNEPALPSNLMEFPTAKTLWDALVLTHTKDKCFKIVGYPEWWSDGHKKGNGKAAVTTSNTEHISGGGGDDLNQGEYGGVAFINDCSSNGGTDV